MALKTDWGAYAAFVHTLMLQQHIAGAAVAVARGDELVYAEGFGVRDVETRAPVTPDTVFGIASVSKSLAALAVLDLAAQGRVALDDPVHVYLPGFALPGADGGRGVCVRHLLSHTTGVPPLRRRPDLAGFGAHLEYLAAGGYRLLDEPGEYLSYCNDTFLLLGAIIERVSGEPLRSYMTRRLLVPLGMERSTYCPDVLVRWDNVVTPYVYDAQEGSPVVRPWPELGNYEVGGGVRSTVLDLVRYGAVYTCARAGKTVAPGVAARMMAPVYQVGPDTHYAHGLQVTCHRRGVTLVHHGGGQVGVSAHFGVVPEADLVVAVLTNVTGRPAEVLWTGAVHAALGWPLPSTDEPAAAAGSPLPGAWVGVYAADEGGRLEVAAGETGAAVRVEGEVFPLRPLEGPYYAFHAQGRRRVVRFYPDGSGQAWAVFANLRMLRRVG